MDQFGRETEKPTADDDEDDDFRVFRVWPEQWEATKIDKNSCAVLEKRRGATQGRSPGRRRGRNL